MHLKRNLCIVSLSLWIEATFKTTWLTLLRVLARIFDFVITLKFFTKWWIGADIWVPLEVLLRSHYRISRYIHVIKFIFTDFFYATFLLFDVLVVMFVYLFLFFSPRTYVYSHGEYLNIFRLHVENNNFGLINAITPSSLPSITERFGTFYISNVQNAINMNSVNRSSYSYQPTFTFHPSYRAFTEKEPVKAISQSKYSNYCN